MCPFAFACSLRVLRLCFFIPHEHRPLYRIVYFFPPFLCGIHDTLRCTISCHGPPPSVNRGEVDSLGLLGSSFRTPLSLSDHHMVVSTDKLVGKYAATRIK